MRLQKVKDLRLETAVDPVFQQLRLLAIRLALSRFDVFDVGQLPNSVVLKSPERILGVAGLSFGTKFQKKRSQISINISKGYQSLIRVHQSTKSVKQQQWFVRGTLFAALPNHNLANLLFELLRSHDGVRDWVHSRLPTAFAAFDGIS